MSHAGKLGIVVAGGPAPGINSVIGAATIRARLSDVDVVGIHDGFRWLMEGDTTHVVPLTIADTSRIHFRGGSTIGTARANPTKDPKKLAATVKALRTLGIDKLITIGGDDTCYTAFRLAEAAGAALRVVHVPKTIDNDLDLPPDIYTFGYQTARHFGVDIVQKLMVDAKTTSRWYLVIAMGRKAGHLALGIGKAAGATVTLIPEEFAGNARLSVIVDTLVGSILKRLSHGRQDGVAVVAEGLVEILPEEDLAGIGDVERDEHGHIRIAEVNLGDIVKRAVTERLRSFGVTVTVVPKNIGYELRSADPIPLDMEYTRDLGYSAARHVIEGGTATLISIQDGRLKPIPFASIMDSETGRMRVRMVDIESDRYKIARTYMLRLKRVDFEESGELEKLARVAGITPRAFADEFGYLVAADAPRPSIRVKSAAPTS